MIAFNLPSTPNHDIRSPGDKSFYNFLATDKNLIDNVDIPDKRGINWQKAQKLGFNRASNLIICFGVGNKCTMDNLLPNSQQKHCPKYRTEAFSNV